MSDGHKKNDDLDYLLPPEEVVEVSGQKSSLSQPAAHIAQSAQSSARSGEGSAQATRRAARKRAGMPVPLAAMSQDAVLERELEREPGGESQPPSNSRPEVPYSAGAPKNSPKTSAPSAPPSAPPSAAKPSAPPKQPSSPKPSIVFEPATDSAPDDVLKGFSLDGLGRLEGASAKAKSQPIVKAAAGKAVKPAKAAQPAKVKKGRRGKKGKKILDDGESSKAEDGAGDISDSENPLFLPAQRLRAALHSPRRFVMGIDQALDGTGFAFVLPLFDVKRVEEFIRKDFARFDERYRSRPDEIVDIFRLRLALGGGAISLRPPNARAKEYSVGLVVGPNQLANGKNEFPVVILHGHLALAASNMPEWEQAKLIAKAVRDLGESFMRLIGSVKDAEVLITVEGLAVRGLAGSLSILPCLGALYTRIWEELMDSPNLRGKVREMPISSWKKAFSDDGRIKKNGVKQLLYAVGFERFGCDDESDATAMALTAATLDYTGKDTLGRIMPTREARAEKRREREEKAERREQKAAAKMLATRRAHLAVPIEPFESFEDQDD